MGEGGNPAGAFRVCDVVAVELDEVGELVGHGSVPLLGCDDRSQSMAVRCTAPEGPQRSGGGLIAVNLLREEAAGGEIYCELALP